MRDFRRFIKGIKFKDNNDGPNAIGDLSGSLTASDNGAIYNYQNIIRVFLDGSERQLLTNDQAQTITNKTIDVDNNTISNIETDNLKAGVLITDVSSATSDTEIPSALAVKNALAGQNDASEINYDNSTSGLTASQVQAAIDEVEGRLDTTEGVASGVASDLATHEGLSSGVHGVTGDVVGTTDTQTLTNKTVSGASIETPSRSDVKQDTEANLTTYASSASNGQWVFATDTKKMYQVVDSALVEGGVTAAADLSYDNSTSGLTATDAQAAIDEVEGRVDTAESSLSSHTGASSGVHGVTGSVVGTTDAQTLTNKTIQSSNIDSSDINLGTASNTSKIVVSKDTKASLDALTKEEGSIYYATDENKYYGDDGVDLFQIGSDNSGLKNYIENSGAESDIAGWDTYIDAASSIPVDGTGGTANITFARNTTTPLSGIGDFLITKDAVNRQGHGISYDFSIDRADRASVLRINFDYITSTNYADDDFSIYIFDVTNSELIQVTDKFLKANSQGKYIGEFQSSYNSTSYRVIFHQASTSAAAYTINMDNVSVGPREIAKGSVVTDWVEWTPTGSWTTNTSYLGLRRRVGDVEQFQVKVSTSGAPSTGSLTVNLPVTIDTAKVFTLAGNQTHTFGRLTINDDSAEGIVGPVMYNDTTSVLAKYVKVTSTNDTSNAMRNVSPTEPMTWTTNDSIHLVFEVPVLGYSSNANISSDLGNRIVAARYTAPTAGLTVADGATTIVDFQNNTFDSTGSVTTGASWKFTAPEYGYYDVKSAIGFSFSATNDDALTISLYKNGTLYSRLDRRENYDAQDVAQPLVGADMVELQGGDYIDIRVTNNTGVTLTIGSDGQPPYINIHKIQSPETLIGSETISMRYTSDAATSIPDATITSMTFEDKDHDTHGMYSGATATIPKSGLYYVNITATWNDGSLTGTAFCRIDINSGESFVDGLVGSSTSQQLSATINTVKYFNKGDTLTTQLFQSTGAARTLQGGGAAAARNYVSITLMK